VSSWPRRLDCRRLRGSDRQESLDLGFGVFLSDLNIEVHAVLAHLLLAHALEDDPRTAFRFVNHRRSAPT
jgi:hypothetical protein